MLHWECLSDLRTGRKIENSHLPVKNDFFGLLMARLGSRRYCILKTLRGLAIVQKEQLRVSYVIHRCLINNQF